MTTELIAPEDRIAAISGELSGLSNEELTSQLFAELTITAERVVRIAAIVRVLEERGVDLSELKLSMMDVLRRVAHGEAEPELIERFQSRPLLLGKTTSLPMSQQTNLLARNEVLVVKVDKAGHIAPLKKRIDELSRNETHQVFSRTGIRSEAEQTAWLQRRQKAHGKSKPDKSAGERPRGVIVNKERGGIEVKGKFISKRTLVRYLAELT